MMKKKHSILTPIILLALALLLAACSGFEAAAINQSAAADRDD